MAESLTCLREDEWAGPDSNRRPPPRKGEWEERDLALIDLHDFENYLRINLRFSNRTVRETIIRVKRFMNASNFFNEESLSGYLEGYLDHAPATYNAELKALRRLGKYLKLPQIAESFKFTLVDIIPQRAPTTDEICIGFTAQTDLLGQALYLFIATTGLRKGEVLNLKQENIDWDNQAVIPRHFTKTKRSGITFFNQETRMMLSTYLKSRQDNDEKLFIVSDRQWKRVWNIASKAAKTRITCKSLRLWHSVELGEKGVGDRYIDIFQGRAPRTTLARHYTSHGLDRLRKIYDNAELQILTPITTYVNNE